MSTVTVVSLAGVVVLVVAFIVAAYTRRWRWAGLTGQPGTDEGSKTLWDWLQLLVIPLGLAAVAFALNLAQSNREQHREDRRAARERSIAADRLREDALATYLQQISDLMLERGLLTSRAGSETQAIARTLTLSVLRRLDPKRKGIVVRFLDESGLIRGRTIRGPEPKIKLAGADLRFVVLTSSQRASTSSRQGGIGFPLSNASFDGADLRYANFRGALLQYMSFSAADLREADFSTATILDVSFLSADLSGANFSQASIGRSNFENTCLSNARFARAGLFDSNLTAASGHDVDLSHAKLRDVTFRYAFFVRSNLAGMSGSRPPSGNETISKRFDNCLRPIG